MPKKNNMPDFDKLTDRIIAEAPSAPMFSIKTNLDSDDPTENNPYFSKDNGKTEAEMNKFKAYFDENEKK
ncbi:hypothetical protein ACJ2A9_01895 [Anaerobacillus sp. MEB173]|uniref:hypothetical protein n=1 Tax=Anaerobacillus sp. MEB173 TaxID=3383345 RepID=UPI003F934C04